MRESWLSASRRSPTTAAERPCSSRTKIRRAEVSAQKYAALISQQDERLLRLEKLKPLRATW